MRIKNWGVKAMMLLLLFTFACASPYKQALKQAEEKVEELREEFDVVIPPGERVPEKGRMAALNTTYGSRAPGVAGSATPFVKQRIDQAVSDGEARKVHVYVLDTAPDTRHPALKDIGGNGKSFVPNDSGSDGDPQGHGTHCLGIVAGVYPAKDIPMGVASYLREHDLITLHAGQVLSDAGSGAFSWIQNGLLWALDNSKEARARGEFIIVSMSLGANTSSTYLDNPLRTLRNAGILVVAANGNTGRTPIHYPGKSPFTWAIAALQGSGTDVGRASYSSFGPETYASALGSSVWSSYRNNEYATLSGTSMATPGVAGILAVLAAIYPDATVSTLESIVTKYSRDLGTAGRDPYFGYGVPYLPTIISMYDEARDDPDEDPGEEPAPDPDPEPEPEPEPEPDPDPTPERPELPKAETIKHISKPLTMRIMWRTRGEGVKDTSFMAKFQIIAEYSTKSKSPEKELTQLYDEYYTRRALVLPGERFHMDTHEKTAYYIVHFLELEAIRKRKLDFDVLGIRDLENGVFLEHNELPRVRTMANHLLQELTEGAYIMELPK